MNRQRKSHVQVGDQVQIMAGAHKKKIGRILFLDKKKSFAILDNLSPFARAKKTKLTKERPTVRTIHLPKAIALSNLMLWDDGIQCASRTIKCRIGKREKCRMFTKTGSFVNVEKHLARKEAKRKVMQRSVVEKNESTGNE